MEKVKLTSDITHLNVGGKRFSTSRQTLLWPQHSFFSSLLSGRIPSLRDETGAIFIDRDPDLFGVILNYLRTNDLNLNGVDISAVRHEAEYYGLVSLVRKLALCEENFYGCCGDVLFHGYILPPEIRESVQETGDQALNENINASAIPANNRNNSIELVSLRLPHSDNLQRLRASLGEPIEGPCSGGAAAIPPPPPLPHQIPTRPSLHVASTSGQSQMVDRTVPDTRHTPDEETGDNGTACSRFRRVSIIRCHQNWLAAAYPNHVGLFCVKDLVGWREVWLSPSLFPSGGVDCIAVNAKVHGGTSGTTGPLETSSCMVAIASGPTIFLWRIKAHDSGAPGDTTSRQVGQFQLNGRPVDDLFFIGAQMVALSRTGRVGVWHSMTHNWQIQDVVPIHSYDVAGSEFLLLGCENGCIYYIDMQKFPLRIVDNDLLVTELYKDPKADPVTALSVYVTPKTSMSGGNWIEIAYGTSSGCVRVIVQHPETVGQGPQLFQTFSVHRAKVSRVVLSERHLISVCSEMHHVRTWSVTRFRGMISTQPGSTPLASFHVISMEPPTPCADNPPLDCTPGLSCEAAETASSRQRAPSLCGGGKTGLFEQGNNAGPYGEKDEQLLFIQKVLPDAEQVFVRLAANGKRVCVIRSVDGSAITSFCVHECDGSSRVVAHPRRYLFTGHADGTVQIWDLTTALDNMRAQNVDNGTGGDNQSGGPTPRELIRLLDSCEITSASRMNTPTNLSPSNSYWSVRQPPGLGNNSQWSLASNTNSSWNLTNQQRE